MPPKVLLVDDEAEIVRFPAIVPADGERMSLDAYDGQEAL